MRDLQTYRQQLTSGPIIPRVVSRSIKGRLSLQLRIKATKVQHEANNHLWSSWRITYEPILLTNSPFGKMGETKPSLPQTKSASVFFKSEEDMLGSHSLQTPNCNGKELQLFSTITIATKIHGTAQILENGTNRIWLQLLTCRMKTTMIQLFSLWNRVWQWCHIPH